MANPTQSGVEVVSTGFKHDENEAVLCNQNVEIKFDGTTLRLAQSWENGEELAPIFSGACWAGTVVWQAALDLCDYMSENLRKELVGANVVELGCGIGVPGMIAHLLGSTVVLTEQDELLSLLEGNLTANFPGDDGIGSAALDWERKEDTDALLASYLQLSHVNGGTGNRLQDAFADCSCEKRTDRRGCDSDRPDEGCQKCDGSSQCGHTRSSESKQAASPYTTTEPTSASSSDRCRGSGRLDFILCADCVFEPLYGDSWKALAKVMGRLSDSETTVLASVERRGVDGVSNFLEACRGEGFEIRMVYVAGPDAPAPVELYELCKGGTAALRGADVAPP